LVHIIELVILPPNTPHGFVKQILVLSTFLSPLFLILSPGVRAQSLPVEQIKTFVDSTGTLSIDDILRPETLSKFSTSRELASHHSTWVAIKMPAGTGPGKYCIDFILPVDLEVFYIHHDSVIARQSGPLVRPSLRSFPSQPLVSCFDIDDKNHSIYMKVPPAVFKGREIADLKYTTYEKMESQTERLAMIYLLMAGSILIVFVIALTMWIFLKDRVFMFFGIYVIFFYLSINKAFITSLFGDLLPQVFLNPSINQLFFICSPLAFLWFAWVYMKMDMSTKWRIPFLISLPFALICIILAFTNPSVSTIPILFFNFGAMVLVTVLAYKRYHREKWRPAGYFLTAMLVPLVVSVVIVLVNLELITFKHLQMLGDISMLSFCLILGVGVVQRYRNSSELENLNDTKDKLLSVLAHDLRGPVGNLNAIMSMLSDKAMSPDEFHMLSGKLKTDVAGAYDMLEGVLHWVNSQRNGIVVRPSNFDIGGLIKEVATIGAAQATAKKIRIVVDKKENISVYADRDHVNIIIRNFLSNAIKFSPENSEIGISFIKTDNQVSVTIQDQGVGLSDEDVRKILRKEKIGGARGTKGEKGIGLGLLLCQEFISYNNGTFYFSSEKDRGTTAGFTIPVQQD